MSKKLLFVPLVIVLFALPLFAAESGPSNTVGFISFEANPGAFVPFSLPFTYYNEGHVVTAVIDDVVIGAFTGGLPSIADVMWDQNLGSSVVRLPNNTWGGSWSSVTAGHAYWVNRNANATIAITVTTAGEVDMSPLDLGTMQIGYNPVGLREPGDLTIQELGASLLDANFTGGSPSASDQVWNQNTGTSAFYNTLIPTHQWMGSLTTIEPGGALWIEVRNTPFDWTYTPSGATVVDSYNPIQIYTPAPSPKPTQTLRKAGEKQSNIEGSID